MLFQKHFNGFRNLSRTISETDRAARWHLQVSPAASRFRWKYSLPAGRFGALCRVDRRSPPWCKIAPGRIDAFEASREALQTYLFKTAGSVADTDTILE